MILQDDATMREILLAVGWTKLQIERLAALRDHIEQGGEPGWMEETPTSLQLKFHRWLAERGDYTPDGGCY